jgi:hypothetical protein
MTATRRWIVFALIAALAVSVAGCASSSRRRVTGVPVDSRPTPPPPPPEPAPGTTPAPAQTPADRPPPPVNTVMSEEEQRETRARIVADTTAASSAVRKCAGRKLLPDQESVFDTTRSLLEQTRAALRRNELWRAESLARKARQLSSSLSCPG